MELFFPVCFPTWEHFKHIALFLSARAFDRLPTYVNNLLQLGQYLWFSVTTCCILLNNLKASSLSKPSLIVFIVCLFNFLNANHLW